MTEGRKQKITLWAKSQLILLRTDFWRHFLLCISRIPLIELATSIDWRHIIEENDFGSLISMTWILSTGLAVIFSDHQVCTFFLCENTVSSCEFTTILGQLGTEHMRHCGTRYWTFWYLVLDISVLNERQIGTSMDNNLIKLKKLFCIFFTFTL